MASYVEGANLIYLASPGTGSTSIERMFTDQLSAVYIDAPASHFRFGTRHASLKELHAYQSLAAEGDVIRNINFSDVKVVTSVRNPWAYAYADWYRNRTKWVGLLRDPDSWVFSQPGRLEQIIESIELSFCDWVRFKFHHDNGIIFGKRHLNGAFVEGANFFIRMEHIEEDLQGIFDELSLKVRFNELFLNQTGEDKNIKRPNTEYWRFYNQDARNIISEVYEPTIIKFAYKF